MKGFWWKILCIILLFYTLWGGFLFEVPRLVILQEGVRNLYFHVPMWFAMLFTLFASVIQAIIYLAKSNTKNDILSVEYANIGILFGVMGIITGMVWATYTWGEPWSNDPKQNASAIALLIYLAYFVLRGALKDEQQKARISAVYNIFAFAIYIPLLYILPDQTDSLHPGNGGNPTFSIYDADNRLKIVFYTAIIGWSLLAFWIANLRVRINTLKQNRLEEFANQEKVIAS